MQLDNDLNQYFMKDKDKGATHLDDDLDSYFKQKGKAAPAAAADGAAAAAGGEEAADMES
jgi:hypothetical protein